MHIQIDLNRYCSLMEMRRAVVASARTFDRAHAVAIELASRDVLPMRHPVVPYASAASLAVVGDARPSVKSSLTYTYTEDRRDDAFLPTMGSYFQTTAEGAGECVSCVLACFAATVQRV